LTVASHCDRDVRPLSPMRRVEYEGARASDGHLRLYSCSRAVQLLSTLTTVIIVSDEMSVVI